MATGRPYNIGVDAGVRVIKADDHIQTRVDIPPLPGISRHIREDLSQRGFKDGGGGTIVRERNGVRTTMNPDDGSLRVEASEEIPLPEGPQSPCGCRIRQAIAAANQATDDLQKKITDRLAKAIPAVGCEIEGAINRASKKALVETAQQIGTVKSIEEGKDGSITIRVEA